MDLRVSVNLAGRGLEDPRPQAFCEPEHVDGAVHRRLGRLDRVVLVVDRRRGTGEVVDLVHLHVERKRHVVPDELEARMVVQVVDVPLVAGEQVVDAEDLVPLLEQPIAQMRAEEAGAAGDEYSLARIEVTHLELDLRGAITTDPIASTRPFAVPAPAPHAAHAFRETAPAPCIDQPAEPRGWNPVQLLHAAGLVVADGARPDRQRHQDAGAHRGNGNGPPIDQTCLTGRVDGNDPEMPLEFTANPGIT